MPPAARVGDLHVCPLHVGGPVLPPGFVKVLIGGLPAARLGDICLCLGPPDPITKGSLKVLIGGQPAARIGDATTHQGNIVVGYPQVLIE